METRSDVAANREGQLGASQAAALADWIASGELDAAVVARARSDAAHGLVSALDGELVWPEPPGVVAGVRRVGRAGGETLPVLPGLGPFPGPYRLYVLPTSRVVVGAEVPGQREPHAPTPVHLASYEAALTAAMLVTPGEVAAIRGRQVTPSLREQAALIARNAAVVALLLAGVAALISIIIPGAIWSTGAIHDVIAGSCVAIIVSPFFLVPWGLAIAAAVRWLRMRRDVTGRSPLRTVEGPVVLTRSTTARGGASYAMNVGGTDVPIGPRTFSLVVRGVPHRAYLFAASGQIAYLEPIVTVL